MRVVIVGAGVVGSAAALALAEAGCEVTLIERGERVAGATSEANGGGVTPLHSEPWNQPGLFGQLGAFMGRRDKPWRLPPSALPGLGLWGMKFLLNSRESRFMRNARADIVLALHSLACLRRWRERFELDYAQTTAGSMQLYFSQPALAASLERRRRLIADLGTVERLDPDAVCEREPALAPVAERLAGALYYPEHESGDACRFARGVADRAAERGAAIRLGEAVERIDCGHDRFRAVETDRDRIEADACVIATGPDTRALLAPLGLAVPIRPVRGYSASFEIDAAAELPTLPLLDAEHRFVSLRLGARGLRIAGLADFAGHRRAVPQTRLSTLLAGASALFPRLAPSLRADSARLWSGLRPVTPDGRPLLGATAIDGLYLDTGHGPMGWTMACGSAELLTELITGAEPTIDPTPYTPGR